MDTESPAVEGWKAIYAEYGQEFPLLTWIRAVVGVSDANFDAAAHLARRPGRGRDRAPDDRAGRGVCGNGRARRRDAPAGAGVALVGGVAPVRRVGAMDTFVAYQPKLEDAILPQPETILKAITVFVANAGGGSN